MSKSDEFISIRRVGYGGLGGAVFDEHIWVGNGKVVYGLGVINSYLYAFSLLPSLAAFIELVNFVISMLGLNLKPELRDNEDDLYKEFALSDVADVRHIERSFFPLFLAKMLLFIPMVNLFSLRFYQSYVVVKLTSGKRKKFFFGEAAVSKAFAEELSGASQATSLELSESKTSYVLDLACFTFNVFVLGVWPYIVTAWTVGAINDLRSSEAISWEVGVVAVFGFWVPLAIKIFLRQKFWQTNYRYPARNSS